MNTEKQYIQAFNNGYILAQYEPDFLNILTRGLTPTNNYLHGLFGGKKQLELENTQEQMFELQQLRYQAQSKGRNLDKGN